MTRGQFEDFVLQQAAARGLDASAPFPFAVRGELPRVSWHVVTGPAAHGGGHGAGTGHARQLDFTGTRKPAVLLGFHSGQALEGVISHPGERFHVHVADPAFETAGHVDAYEVSAGAKLLLPQR